MAQYQSLKSEYLALADATGQTGTLGGRDFSSKSLERRGLRPLDHDSVARTEQMIHRWEGEEEEMRGESGVGTTDGGSRSRSILTAHGGSLVNARKKTIFGGAGMSDELMLKSMQQTKKTSRQGQDRTSRGTPEFSRLKLDDLSTKEFTRVKPLSPAIASKLY
ncbi:hypothetical protein ADUPG1_012646 [Aduncisulcus paluster]|uniref:Uncharacterized protein n=1 Tax=Aduncisulcus paluster TaxID=2918883 RepID=A0ABQ5K057_9EUKA|nr:hypothetical protein ADUPG1_012646 [Aduncisulcus paluster]